MMYYNRLPNGQRQYDYWSFYGLGQPPAEGPTPPSDCWVDANGNVVCPQPMVITGIGPITGQVPSRTTSTGPDTTVRTMPESQGLSVMGMTIPPLALYAAGGLLLYLLLKKKQHG